MRTSLLLLVLAAGSAVADPSGAAKWDPRLAQRDAVVDADGVKWIDGTRLPIEGRTPAKTVHYYDRLPDTVTTNVNGGVREMRHYTAGLQFRFSTDSKFLILKWRPYHPKLSLDCMPATSASGIDVYRFDRKRNRWVYRATGSVVDAEKGGCLRVDDLTDGDYIVNLPLYNGVKEIALGIESNATVRALPPRPNGIDKPVVFYGTSITHGGCCSRPGMAFPSILGRALDVPILNLGFAGCGVMEFEMSDHLADVDASCYVLDCLWNMALREDQKPGCSLEGNYERFIRNLRKKRPDVPIIMVEHSDVFLGHGTLMDLFVLQLHDKLIAEGWRNLLYLPKKGMFEEDGEGTVDGCHPNDWGMMTMAKAYGKIVAKALGLRERLSGLMSKEENDR